MSIVDLPALNPHCASGYMRSESNCKQLQPVQYYTGKGLPNDTEEVYSTVVVAVTPLFLKSVMMLASGMFWGTVP